MATRPLDWTHGPHRSLVAQNSGFAFQSQEELLKQEHPDPASKDSDFRGPVTGLVNSPQPLVGD